jgi:putative addiction module component (TIGR02574 family)
MNTVPNPDAEVEELWSIEAERRWHEIEAGTAQTIPWEEVRTRLFADREPPSAKPA